MPSELALVAIGVGCAAWTTWSDVRDRRIPNAPIGLAAIAAILARASDGGAGAVTWGVIGAALALTLAIVPYAAGRVGAGDVKLAGALGLVIGPVAVVPMAAVATAAVAASAIVFQRRAITFSSPANATYRGGQGCPRTKPTTPPLKGGVTAVPVAPALAIGAAAGTWMAAGW